MKDEKRSKMDLESLFKENSRPGMVIVSDVDGVHTSPRDGVKISAKSEDGLSTIFTLKNGTEVLELFSEDGKKEFCLGGFSGESIMEFYQFHTPDGQAILNLLRNDVRVIIVSGRNAAPVKDRFSDKLKAETYLGVRDKFAFFQDFEDNFNLGNVIFISDGHQDASLLKAVSEAGGVAVSTADCEPEARVASDAQTTAKGGEGAFAELAEMYLKYRSS